MTSGPAGKGSAIRAVIFDFFDVLRTDPFKAWLTANGLKREGPYAEAARQQDMGEITAEDFLQLLSELQGRPITREEMNQGAKVDDAVVALAERLRKNYRTALVSNAPSVIIRGLLTAHDLARHFDVIIISSEVGFVKPSAEIFQLALAKLDVPAEEAVFIDDNEQHTQAAEKLGIKSIQFHSAAQLSKELKKVGVVIQ